MSSEGNKEVKLVIVFALLAIICFISAYITWAFVENGQIVAILIIVAAGCFILEVLSSIYHWAIIKRTAGGLNFNERVIRLKRKNDELERSISAREKRERK